ncbi:glycosyltransferase family 2 protein [Parashewanella curva]|uniref:Glycosyltransferase family 2 protein n=1 Tax=Parashewanella curva TaxID=2338552 RepID=A0A3L8PYL2_9GAMM|nr:glycosyltransferase family 2 protein [Parashewanella curva]RLV60526.1 glycosyltransferase family 2 protein [Parashewanella curva]
MRTAIVIPNYNHKDAISETLEKLTDFGLSCYLINDGSDLETTVLLESLETKYSWVTLIHHSNNQGKGGAVITGLKAAFEDGYSHAIQIDADGQHNLNDIPKMLSMAAQYPDSVISGLPEYDESIPKGRLYGRYITHFWVWVETLSFEIKDSMCGFRVYPLCATVGLIESESLGKRMDFDIEILVKLHWRGTRVKHVPTAVIYPENGVSHFQGLHDNLRISKLHTKLFFGMLARIPRWLLKNNSNEQHWSKTKERGSYLGIKILAASYRLGGHILCRSIMYPVIGYFFITGRQARKASLNFYQQVYEYHHCVSSFKPSIWKSLKHFLSFGDAALDRLDAWCDRIKLDEVIFPGRMEFDKLIRSNKGAVLLASHLGNIELCRALSVQNKNIKINVLVRISHAENFNRILKQLNPNSDVNLLPVDDMSLATSVLLQEKIAQGELVVIAADRTSQEGSERVFYSDFLGKTAAFAQGPFILSSLLDCPVYSIFCIKNQHNKYQVFLEKLSDSLNGPRKQRMQRLQDAVDIYSKRLSVYAGQYPQQWFNFFDFWHKQPQQQTVSGNDFSAQGTNK